MRQIVNLNRKWAFSKEATQVPTELPKLWNWVNLPHSWNAIDGQDGGSDYHLGTCYYAKEIEKLDLPKADRYYLEINGANASADVYVNGKHLRHHDGGYSTWRVDITEEITAKTLLVIAVDNGVNETVYPQVADFTFYGGLYRNVNLVCVSESHFDLETNGTPGIHVTPIVEGKNAHVDVEVFLTNATEDQSLCYTLLDMDGNEVSFLTSKETAVSFYIENVHLWNGRKDPYLYSVTAELLEDDTILDTVSTRFGCRSFEIDPDRGFILNGEEYPLRGVARHQDRWDYGNALLPEHHKEDMDLICELGATTIRLAHYQHDQYFYDLCDERGMVIWAEVPYISKHMPGGRENTISQMTELITQNYNHPSIVVWGLSNEITMNSEVDEDLLENHRILNELVHKMDKTRLTTLAALSSVPMDSEYIKIPNVVSYNHYFGWYGGTPADNGPWMDQFHEVNPTIPIGMSEYGCEALNWHNSNPEQGDYTEEYQAIYHEELIRQLYTRKYIWATHCWNMFDFGADTRNEGGEAGQNHKGLVTIDRKYKKDAFYAYKAWLSDEPFVHICGKRYIDRVEDVTKVTVYSNQSAVELFANGISLGVKEAPDHFFYFEVPNAGVTHLTAKAGDCRDESTIRKVETFNNDYRMKEKGAVLNWFDITEPEGFLSLNSKLAEVMASPQGNAFFFGLINKMMPPSEEGGMKVDASMFDIMSSFTMLRLMNMAGGTLNIQFSKEDLLALNAQLNQIPKA